jgi:hypothetical protein
MISFRKAAIWAFVVFVALFSFRFGYATWFDAASVGQGFAGGAGVSAFETSRKNYASEKLQPGAPTVGDTQKFEKVGTLAANTSAFDADRRRIADLIASTGSVIQLERTQGLDGRRGLNLGVGVPPEQFDAFIQQARGIGRLTRLDVTKNDKTNEYLQLRAKRNTLDKARTALERLQQPDGKLEDRLSIQNRLTEIEQQIQDLGVSLGEFDAANELCTVKLSLTEVAAAAPDNAAQRHMRNAMRSLEWTATTYLAGAAGLAVMAFAFWIAAVAFQLAGMLLRRANAAPTAA